MNILGPKARFPKNNGPSNPAIYNEFAAAAYRMGHSQLRSFIQYRLYFSKFWFCFHNQTSPIYYYLDLFKLMALKVRKVISSAILSLLELSVFWIQFLLTTLCVVLWLLLPSQWTSVSPMTSPANFSGMMKLITVKKIFHISIRRCVRFLAVLMHSGVI